MASQVPRKTSTPAASDAILRNPERGFYRATDILAEDTLSWIDDEYSLYFSYVRLDDYRDSDLPQEFLTSINQGMAKVRAEGAKLVLRFSYNFGPYPNSEPDASLTQILSHIDQLGPVLRDNADVLATLQAGFIGAWGEWHTSTNGLANVADKTTVLESLLKELPLSRTVQVRYPPDIMAMFNDTPLSPNEAWSGSVQSRTGHHNDCFLAGERDTGTYPGPTDPEVYKTFLSANNLYVPMGGETCAVSAPRSECAVALAEMELLRFSFINANYEPDVVDSWTSGGCRPEMERRLGYRLVATEVDLPESVAPGDPFVGYLTLTNEGWAAPMNPRPAFVVLEQGNEVYRLALDDFEIRTLMPSETSVITLRGLIPESFSDGTASLSLWLPDDSAALRNDARYSIQLANEGFNVDTGAHSVGMFTIAEGAPTDNVPGATALEVGWQ